MLVYERPLVVTKPSDYTEVNLMKALTSSVEFETDENYVFEFPKEVKELTKCGDYYRLFRSPEFITINKAIVSLLADAYDAGSTVYLKDDVFGFQGFEADTEAEKFFVTFGQGHSYVIDTALNGFKVGTIKDWSQIFGTFEDIPDEEEDSELEYATPEGFPIEDLTLNETYVDDGKGGIIRVADDENVQALLDGEIIVPKLGKLESIEIATLPDITTYDEESDHTLDLTGLVVSATYENGTTVEVSDYTTDPEDGSYLSDDGSASGVHTVSVEVSYKGKTASFDVTVKYQRE